MKSFALEVEVTETLLHKALPQLRDAARLAVRERMMRQARFALPVAASLVPIAMLGLAMSVFIVAFGFEDDRSLGWLGCAVFLVVLPLAAVMIHKIASYRKGQPARLVERLSEWSVSRSVNKLVSRTPYEVRYQIDQDEIAATVDKLGICRRTSWKDVNTVLECDHFFAFLVRRYFRLWALVYVEGPQQHGELQTFLRDLNITPVDLASVRVKES